MYAVNDALGTSVQLKWHAASYIAAGTAANHKILNISKAESSCVFMVRICT